MSMLSGGAVVAALAVAAIFAKIRRQRRVAEGRRALRGKVVLITGASSGLGEGNLPHIVSIQTFNCNISKKKNTKTNEKNNSFYAG